MGSTCSILNDNDYMASTTTLQSHIPPILEIVDTDENQDDVIEGETNSVTGYKFYILYNYYYWIIFLIENYDYMFIGVK